MHTARERLLLAVISIGERNTYPPRRDEGSVADEPKTENSLHRRAEGIDVGSLAEGGFPSRDRQAL